MLSCSLFLLRICFFRLFDVDDVLGERGGAGYSTGLDKIKDAFLAAARQGERDAGYSGLQGRIGPDYKRRTTDDSQEQSRNGS